MKLFSRILSVVLLFWIGLFWVNTNAFSILELDDRWSIPYCQWDDKEKCSVEWGIKETESISSVVTDQKASEYIQKIVSYILTFTAIIAVLYIIYAGFNILTGSGDEEKMKKSKSIITYVILGIVIMFLAYSIVTFIFEVLDRNTEESETVSTAQVQVYS